VVRLDPKRIQGKSHYVRVVARDDSLTAHFNYIHGVICSPRDAAIDLSGSRR
jgi:hypothetical protein